MSHVSGGGSIDLSDTDSLQEWINMTGFLCALGGVCLQQSWGKRQEFPACGFNTECLESGTAASKEDGNSELFLAQVGGAH